jgi:Flp pilus assembly protein TadG
MYVRQHRQVRRGATLAESAIISMVFLMLTLGMIDLGVGVYRFNTISQAARHGVRQASVHGALAPSGWRGGNWGTTRIDALATDTTIPGIDAVRPMLTGCPVEQTRIIIEWPDNDNGVEKNVRVTVTTPYRPLVTWFLGSPTITLSSTATMPIAH